MKRPASNKKDTLKRLLQPKSIAVFGGSSAAKVIRQCQSIGYSGDIWAVNPNRSELAGLPCFAGISDLPAVPDASFIAAPPAATLEIVKTLATRGAPGAVCFAAGFAETGDDGVLRQEELKIAAGDMAVIGPNCHGYLNYLDGMALWPDEHGGHRSDSGVALIAQSGNIAINLTMQQRGLSYSYVISVGNNSALGMHDYIEALLDDPRVTAIGLHIEGLDDIHAFSQAAIRALGKGVPIVVFKAGRSERGAQITLSHTGSLAGSDTLYSALFKRLGIARCDTIAQFLETLKFVSTVGVLTAPTIGSMSCSGGDATIVADNAEALGLETPPLSVATAARLRELLGPNVDVANPLDYHLYIWGDLKKLTACFAEVLRNAFSCTLLVLDYPPGENTDDANWQITEKALLAAVVETGQRAVIVSSMVETLSADARCRLKTAGIAGMQGIEDCLFAISSAAAIGMAQATAGRVLPVMPPSWESDELELLDEWQSKQQLAAAGVSIPLGRICNQDESPKAAGEIGFPVVLKALASGLAHKSEADAVAVGLADEDAVRAAVERMSGLYDRFLVEKMHGPAVAELIVGISRDPTFGLSLLVGTGGTLVELLQDTVSLLLPVQRADIENAILSSNAGTLINGYRGSPAGDLARVISEIEAIATYAMQNEEILYELDVNPLLVTPTTAVAVDALIRNRVSTNENNK